VRDQRPYEGEHLFTKRTGAYRVTDPDGVPFHQIRARIGALVLLDGAENASLGGGLLADKTGAYRAANWLAASLDLDSYRRGSVKFRDFLKMREATWSHCGLPACAVGVRLVAAYVRDAMPLQ
jgi:hypothetical protein